MTQEQMFLYVKTAGQLPVQSQNAMIITLLAEILMELKKKDGV